MEVTANVEHRDELRDWDTLLVVPQRVRVGAKVGRWKEWRTHGRIIDSAEDEVELERVGLGKVLRRSEDKVRRAHLLRVGLVETRALFRYF